MFSTILQDFAWTSLSSGGEHFDHAREGKREVEYPYPPLILVLDVMSCSTLVRIDTQEHSACAVKWLHVLWLASDELLHSFVVENVA